MDINQIRIRHYQGGDETALIACWNRCLPYDTINEGVFVSKVLCDHNFDPAGLLVAEAPGGDIVGFLLALVRQTPIFGSDLEPSNGWITAFGVDPDWQRLGIARALFAAAELFFTAQGRTTIFFASYSPNYFVPGIDAEHYPAGAACLDAMGFSKVSSCVAMDINLALFTIPNDVKATTLQREEEGYRFELLTTAYITDTIALAHKQFSQEWGRAIREALVRGIPYDHFLIAIDPNDRVVGYCMYGSYDHSPDRFGPFGVLDSERGKGLGKVLLHQCLNYMRSKGVHGAWFLWTGENSPAGLLYKRAGFTITRRFAVMKKQLVAE